MLFHMRFSFGICLSAVALYGLDWVLFICFGTFTLEIGIFAINIKQLCLKSNNTQHLFFMQLQEN